MTEKKISLTQSQLDFYQILMQPESAYPLFVAGPGSGKSYILGLCAVTLAQHHKKADVYIYAPEHHHIRTIEVPNIEFWLDALKIKHGKYSEHKGMIEVDDPQCANIYFKPMNDPNVIVGYQSYAALIDELDTFSEEKAALFFDKITQRNRLQIDGIPKEKRIYDKFQKKWVCSNKTATFTTPEGYNFCYKNWELRNDKDHPIVRGDTRDNPNATERYIQSIFNSHPPHVAEKYISGHFVNMKSLNVYHAYDPELHDSYEEIQPGEPLYIGCDFNVDNTAATVYVRRGKTWHAVDELSKIRDAATLADKIVELYQSKGHHITMYPDSSGTNRNNANASSASAIQELRNRGFRIKAFERNGLVDDRVNATNKAFKENLIFINQRKCIQTSRCLINQAYNKEGKPDKRNGYDHQNDATTYPIVYELGLNQRLFAIPYSFAQKSDFR